MAKVKDVARLFIDIAGQQAENGQGDGMTNLRLQKLLYFAQGWYMARYGKPLFTAPIEAWKLGPVVPTIYGEYQHCGNSPIHDDPPAEDAFTAEEFELLMDVVREYDRYSTSALIDMTHENGTPWAKAFRQDMLRIPLDNAEIMKYFEAQNPLPTFKDVLEQAKKKIPVISPIGYTENGAAIFRKEDAADWGEWDE